MNRLVYWGINVIVIPVIVMAITLAFGPKGGGEDQIKHSANIMFYVIIFIFPILAILRLKYLKYTWKEIWQSYFSLSLTGLKLRWRTYFGK